MLLRWPLVASRSLLEGILTVSRIDFFESSDERAGGRATVTEGDDVAAARRGRDMLPDGGELDIGAVRVGARERKERRVLMLNLVKGSQRKVDRVLQLNSFKFMLDGEY